MTEENKNIQTENSDLKPKQSSIENDELTIAPMGGDAGISIVPTGKEDSPKEQNLDQSISDPVQVNSPTEVQVVAKPKKEKKSEFFDVQLEKLSNKIDKDKIKKVIKSHAKSIQLFIFRKKKKKSFVETFAVTAAFVVFSAALFAGSVFADISYLKQKSEFTHKGITYIGEVTQGVFEGDLVDTTGENGAALLIGDRGVIRLGSDTKLSVDTIDEDASLYIFVLENGNVWGNNLYGDSSIVIGSNYANLYAENASFSMVLDDTKTTVYTDKHDTRVDLIADGDLINTLWIAEGNQAQIIHSKIDSEKETIKKLLYSKLIKEFNYGRLNDKKKKEDPWLSAQLENDIAYFNNLQSDYSKQVNEKGLRTVSVGSLRSQAKSFLADLQSALTFNENKKSEQLIAALFENIADAEYLFLQGNEVDGKVRLSIFDKDMSELLLTADENIKNQLFEKIKGKYYKLSLFVSGDEAFPIKQLMFEKLNDPAFASILTEDDKFILLTAKLNDVYEAVDSNLVDLNTLFSEYFELYDKYTKSHKDTMHEIEEQIIHQNILVDNLLFQTPELYKLEFFDQKKGMESDYLLALSSSRDKQEQRQTFISNDIDLLSRIRYFLFNEQIDAEDARQIVYRLIQDIEDYKEGTVNVAAVNELFDKRLADFGVFWEYLQATEYSSTQLHGASHNERFEEFKKIQEEELTYADIRDEILGSAEVTEESIEEIEEKSQKDLEDAGIQDVEFGTLTDLSKTRIPILSARAGGIKFRATYDWDRQLLSNIIVDNIVISQDGVKLLKAKTFITQTMASLSQAEEKEVVQPTETEEEDELASVKRVASVFLADKFAKMGVVITMDNVEIVDLDAGHYIVTDVYLSELKQAKFSFEYYTGDDKVSNLIVQTKAGEKSVDDTFPSMFINDVVLKIYDEAN